MIPDKAFLRDTLKKVIVSMREQGYDVSGADARLEALPESYDALIAFGEALPDLPMRADFAYVEPVKYADIVREMHPDRGGALRGGLPLDECARKAETAFLGSVLGCVLGKPLEINPTYAELKAAGEKTGEWPLDDFVSPAFLDALGRRHGSWTETARGNIRYVAPDDDLNYSVMGLLNLEAHGLEMDTDGVRRTWLEHQNMAFVFGPERVITALVAADRVTRRTDTRMEDGHYARWADRFNPGNELCGAAIRADAYGYAFPGRPDLAARLACVDASFTHRRTGVYATMFISAAIAAMYCAKTPLDAFTTALMFVPQRSRFARRMARAIDIVACAASFEEGYERVHQEFLSYDHCKVYQEVGTLVNTLRFAENVWQGVCLQVSQGNDTDSFGCTAGSLLGVWFGPDGLDARRLDVFHDEIRVSLAGFYEHSLSALAARFGRLPALFAKDIAERPPEDGN